MEMQLKIVKANLHCSRYIECQTIKELGGSKVCALLWSNYYTYTLEGFHDYVQSDLTQYTKLSSAMDTGSTALSADWSAASMCCLVVIC